MAFELPLPPVRDSIGTIELYLEDVSGTQADVSMRGSLRVLDPNGVNAGAWNGDIRAQLEKRAAAGDAGARDHMVNLWKLLQYIRQKATEELLS